MRIVIDLQAAQAENRKRGIGRYSMSLALAMARNRKDNEVFIALSGLFPDSIELIREAFAGLLPRENIRVWHAVPPIKSINSANYWRREIAELIREAFLASIKPDMVHISSLFEGLVDDAATSVGSLSRSIPTAVTLYDLIPFIHRKPYMDNPAFEDWYLGKIEHLRRADLWLAISESSRREGIEYLGLPDECSVNISTDADALFHPLKISSTTEEKLRRKYSLTRPFVMYTGGIDYRKNIDGLIRAFAKLPNLLRQQHQLAIVCSARDEDKYRLWQLAKNQDLTKDDVVLTGFVPEDDLVALYNLCKLFVFPSWHEGFGLPALEAMRCGAPVIGANSSSLPEVIGWEEALFDPYSEEAIAAKIERALTDEVFRTELICNGNAQFKLFSWDESARQAINAMESFHAKRKAVLPLQNVNIRRPKLAYISPLPPEKSGIADYSASLLPELARSYEIDVVVAQDIISDTWIKKNCPVRSFQWFAKNSNRYERVLYHFGNSVFHKHMFELLEVIPGVVVLHDFFLSGIVAHEDFCRPASGYWARELYNSHGYPALRNRFHTENLADVVWKYPCSLRVIQDSLGIIVHSPNSLRLAKKWYGDDLSNWAVIPLLRDSRIDENKIGSRKALGFEGEDFLVCSFGILGQTKLNLRLLQAWLDSSLAQDKKCQLIFVGENHPGNYGRELLKTIHRNRADKNVRITGWVDKNVFHQYLAAADIGVQLRTLSRGETSAAVLDCMSYGIATIVNANGSIANLDDEVVWKLPDKFFDEQLIEALESLRQNKKLRRQMGKKARDTILRDHNPRTCARLYVEATEHFYQSGSSGFSGLLREIAEIHGQTFDDSDFIRLADAIAQSFPPRNSQRQLLVDISELVQRDSGSGIQRVIRNILKEWLNNPPEEYRVEPVYATQEKGYRYARRFTQNFLGCPDDVLQDEPIEYAPGDVFIGLDLQPHIVCKQKNYLAKLKCCGVKVVFVIYDLLPILMPQAFIPGADETHKAWLEVLVGFNGLVCISKAVAKEVEEWINEYGSKRQFPPKINWFHLGADIDISSTTTGFPDDAEKVLGRLRSRSCFLIVGTIEPRKGHGQVLDAFEQLWQAGQDVNLIIVGKQGWMVESLVERLNTHPEVGGRLFWLEGISDEYLKKVYMASNCLIAASYGEGFCLPLIEAAQHNLPIIARDIPVFREVAGVHAFYFNGKAPGDLAQAIIDWLRLYEADKHPTSAKMPWLTWKESAARLMQIVIENDTKVCVPACAQQ